MIPPSGELMIRQQAENARLEYEHKARRLANMSVSRCIREAAGTTADMVDLLWHQGGPKDLVAFFGSDKDHLGGLGILLVTLASCWLFVDVVLG